METSQQILIFGGLAMLVLGIVTGNIMAWIRKDQPNVPRYLSLAHEGCYQQGAMLLGLAVAAGFSTLSSGTEQLAAWLLVIAALLLFGKDFYNWSAGVDDEFKARGLGLGLGFLMGPLHTVGVVLLLVGCIQAL